MPDGANERKSHAVFLEVCERSSIAEQRRSGSFNNPYKFNDYGGKSFKKAFDEHTVRSAELDEEIEERDSPMPLKINNKIHRQTGLYYYGARYYNPRTSVWLSVDPLAEKYPNYTPYAYAANNPIIYIDPNGLEPIPWYRRWVGEPRKAWQWYSFGVSDRISNWDSKTFHSAAVYNTNNLRASAYETVNFPISQTV